MERCRAGARVGSAGLVKSGRFGCKSKLKSADSLGTPIKRVSNFSPGIPTEVPTHTASAKVYFTASAEARLTFARLAATHPVAIGGKFESTAVAFFQPKNAAAFFCATRRVRTRTHAVLRADASPRFPPRCATARHKQYPATWLSPTLLLRSSGTLLLISQVS
jgi:hypothetical protein